MRQGVGSNNISGNANNSNSNSNQLNYSNKNHVRGTGNITQNSQISHTSHNSYLSNAK